MPTPVIVGDVQLLRAVEPDEVATALVTVRDEHSLVALGNGDVDLDRVINRMLIVAAKTMGADKVANLQFDITPDAGIWTLRKLIGWRSAQASGVAVQVEAPTDADADQGPEAPAPAP